MDMTDETGARLHKLPVWRTIVDGYAIVFRTLPSLLKHGWLLLFGALLAIAAISWFSWSEMSLSPKEDTLVDVVIEFIGDWIAIVAALPSVARLHRFMVMGRQIQTQTFREVTDASARCFKAYVILFLPLFLLLAAESSDSGLFLADEGVGEFVASNVMLWLVVVGCVVWLLFYPRLAIRVAAVAVGRCDVGWRDVWRASRGNMWRLVACLMALIVPVAIFSVVFLMPNEVTTRADSLLTDLVSALVEILMMLFVTALLSLAYLHFFGARDSTPDELAPPH